MVDNSERTARFIAVLTDRFPSSVVERDCESVVWILQIDCRTQATVEFVSPPIFRMVQESNSVEYGPIVLFAEPTVLIWPVIREIESHLLQVTQTVEPPPPHKPRTNLSTQQLAVGDVVWVPIGYKATEATIEDVAFESACTTVTAKVREVGRMELDIENIFADQELCLRDMYEYFLSGQEAVRRQLDLI